MKSSLLCINLAHFTSASYLIDSHISSSMFNLMFSNYFSLLFPRLARQSDVVSFKWLNCLSTSAKDSDSETATLHICQFFGYSKCRFFDQLAAVLCPIVSAIPPISPTPQLATRTTKNKTHMWYLFC